MGLSKGVASEGREVTDIPVIFSAPMVLALLREVAEPGTGKTMTRRLAWRDVREDQILTEQGLTALERKGWVAFDGADDLTTIGKPSPWQKVKAGDRLYVRESIQRFDRDPPTAQYMADITGVPAPAGFDRHPNGALLWRWKQKALPSIHLPRALSRLTLTVSSVKIERLQDITEADARAEGVQATTGGYGVIGPGGGWLGTTFASAREAFAYLWMSLHGAASWDSSPWVVAPTFTVTLANIDAERAAA